MTKSADREWFEVLRAALPVVIVTQRESGLWSLPTSEFDRYRTFARPGTTEARHRQEDAFGHETISVTWRALRTLRNALGTIPSGIVLDAFRAVEDLKSKSGAYGRRREGWKAESVINESARHTAMALTTLLEFGDLVSPKAPAIECLPSIRWLLDHQLGDGGWLYQQSHDSGVAEPITTACCLLALCEFAEIAKVEGSGVEGEITAALRKGFIRLLELRGSTIWEFEHAQPETEMADASHVVWLILCASETTPMLKAVPSARSDAIRIVEWMWQQRFDNGMPGQLGGRTTSALAALHTLFLFLCLTPAERAPGYLGPDRVMSDSLLQSFRKRQLWKQMAAWDWCVLGELAARRIARAGRTIDIELISAAQAIRLDVLRGTFYRHQLSPWTSPFSKLSRKPMLYALSRGRPGAVPSGRIDALIGGWPIWLRWLVAQLPGGVLGYYISEILRTLR